MIKYTTTAIYSVCVLFLLLLRCWLVWAVDDVALSSQTACWTRMASLRREYQQNWNGACMEHLRPIYDPDLYVIWLIKSVLKEDRNFDGITQPRAPRATHLSVCFIEILFSRYIAIACCCWACLSSLRCTYAQPFFWRLSHITAQTEMRTRAWAAVWLERTISCFCTEIFPT